VLTATSDRGAASTPEEWNVFGKQSRNCIDFAVWGLHYHLAKGGVVAIDDALEGAQILFTS
jgi:hypothetical protein